MCDINIVLWQLYAPGFINLKTIYIDNLIVTSEEKWNNEVICL